MSVTIMKAEAAPVIRLADYRPPAFVIVETTLIIDLDFSATQVSARHRVIKKRRAEPHLILHRGDMRVNNISLDGRRLAHDQFRLEADKLIVLDVPDEFELRISNTIAPDKNTALSGLYHSGGMLCTQCEAEGFRRITPAMDRPDNLSCYRVTLRADKKTMPLLLCNGNLVEHGDLPDDSPDGAPSQRRHYATWHDPFPKPTYLFAIVAGDLACMTDRFATRGGRVVDLRFFAAARDIDKCAHALASLKRAMAWDERVYGREYDLDLYHVVAVGDFNMGAMENKSLNIFNTQYVLADSSMATDGDFESVEAVIGHEYFHNWSGNRVTCRDWFQLSLKEGFTVFREQQFSADMGSKAVKRIEDAAALRNHQFPEDAGPMAHAVRPDSYIEINNFYTATVYNKGAEVVRMLHTLLGAEKFRAATDLYFARHDGQAVTTDDFVRAMEDAGGMDLTRFKNWYSQAGTPVVEASTAYHAEDGIFELTLSQSCPPTPGQANKAAFVIPVRAALFARDGQRIAMRPGQAASEDELLVLAEPSRQFVFHLGGANGETAPAAKPVASLLRDFSAPVELRQPLDEDELALLLAHEDDPFNRWEAGQKLYLKHILQGVARIQAGQEMAAAATVTAAFAAVLAQPDADPALQAAILTLPGEAYISERVSPIDPSAIFQARRGLKRHLATALKPELLQRFHALNHSNDGAVNAKQIANRSLRDACLGCLASLNDPEISEIAADLLKNARCMTDSMAALQALVNAPRAAHRVGGPIDPQALLDGFYQRWKDQPLVVDKWLRIQAGVTDEATWSRVQTLTRHPAFDPANPNKVYALILGFIHGNPACFHAADGRGYRFAADWVARLDPLNSQVSARIISAFTRWRQYTPNLKERMRNTLTEINQLPNLSKDVAEIVNKSLAG